MPRVAPKRSRSTEPLIPLSDTSPPTPTRIESTLLVVEQFRDPGGTEWHPGDRAPLARMAIREAVRSRPELFVIEHETLPVTEADLDGWLADVEARYQERYEQVKAHRDGATEREEAALREELKEQERAQPDLERRFRRQEKERAERERKAREEHERRIIENELEFMGGFHYKR